MTRRILTWAPLAVGVALFIAAVARIDRQALADLSGRLGLAIPLVIFINGLSQIVRTLTWRWCFPPGVHVPFLRLLRLRLAAEAFSYVTVSGVAGDPLKVVLLRDEVPAAAAAASVILERLSYIIVTFAFVGVWAGFVLATMPLPAYWRGVFFWFALIAAIFIVFTVIAIRGEGTYMSRLLERLARATRGLLGTHMVGRFLVSAERQILEFARADRRRIVRVVAGDLANYLLMAAEVVVVLRAVGVNSSFAAALTIETFTRVVSVVAAPIPAGLGALEASHLAVASALGVPTAGAALALARRVRGLFWAGVGFAIYPRSTGRDGHTTTGRRSDGGGRTLLYFVDDPSVTISPSRRLAGLPIAERVLRPAARAGYSRVIAWAPRSATELRTIARRLGSQSPPVHIVTTQSDWEQLVGLLAPEAYDSIAAGDILKPSLHVAHESDVLAAEEKLRQSVFKPTDGVVARFNRRISLPISLLLIRTPITPNQISVALVGLGFWAAWLFSAGTYMAGVAGALLSLAASILDGCDGEIARLKYQESAFGCWLETVGDYSYYVAIFIGMTIGAVRSTGSYVFYDIGVASLGGAMISAAVLLVLRRRVSGDQPDRFGAAAGAHLVSTGGWRSKYLAVLSRCATRAVMPYGILVLALLNLAPVVVVLAAIGANVYWIVMTARFRAWLSPAASTMARVGEP